MGCGFVLHRHPWGCDCDFIVCVCVICDCATTTAATTTMSSVVHPVMTSVPDLSSVVAATVITLLPSMIHYTPTTPENAPTTVTETTEAVETGNNVDIANSIDN